MNAEQKKSLRESLVESYKNAAAKRESSGIPDWKAREREKFVSLLKEEQKQTLLELGAGVGHDGKFFQDQGLDVTCIDLSPANVELCRQKGLKATVMDMVDIQIPDASFDAVYAMNSLLHLPKVDFPVVLGEIDRLLKPDGVAFIGVYGGEDSEGVWEKDTYTPRRFFSFFTDEQITREIARVLDIQSFTQVTFGPGEPIHLQVLILRKKA